MVVSSLANIGISDISLRPMACQIAVHSHVLWIQPQSFLVKMIPIFEDITKYRRLIGSLLHLTYIRLDLSNSEYSQPISSAPRQSHWQVAIRVPSYVAYTLEYGLSF